jgi:hypothetical protein
MIARKDWFERRKYGGWGVSPKSWQGWVYIAFILIPFMVFQALPFWTMQTRMTITIIWMVFLFADLIPVMINLKRDEREYKIEAISERNAAWFMSLILVIGVFYEVVRSSLNQEVSVNIFLILALLGGAIVKSISNYILEREKL